MKWGFSLILTTLLSWAQIGNATQQGQLELLAAYPIDAGLGLEPSGLASCDGDLLFISDNQDRNIYRLTLIGGNFHAEVAHSLQNLANKDLSIYPPARRQQLEWAQANLENYHDWEGITCDDGDTAYLASETYADIMVVRLNSTESQWLESPLYTSGTSAGWFQVHNAYIEGIAYDGHGGFIVAAERESRGLAKIKRRYGQWQIKIIQPQTSPIPPSGIRPNDFSGLVKYGRYYLSLERNASAVCVRNKRDLAVSKCWSFEHVESNSLYAYNDNSFGIAEGITVHENRLYIIVDNNNDTRVNDPSDTRPQLFVFKIPEDIRFDD